MALSAMPLSLLNCSESEPSRGVYFALIATKSSAKDWMAFVREVNVDEGE